MKNVLVVGFILSFVLLSYGEITLPYPLLETNTVPEQVSTEVEPVANAVKPKPLRLALGLTDGSRIIGIPAVSTLEFATAYTEIKVSLKMISVITMADDKKSASLILTNGDSLQGVMKTRKIKLKTLFGTHSVGLELVKKIDVYREGSVSAKFRKGLMFHYSFDKPGKEVVRDNSPNRHHAKVNGAKWIAAGKSGGAYSFDGVDDYIDASEHVKALNFPAPATLSMWIKAGPQTTSTAYSISQRANNYYLWRTLLGSATGRLNDELVTVTRKNSTRVGSNPILGYTSKNPEEIFDEKWHHIAIVPDGKSTRIYVDGVSVKVTVGFLNDAGQFAAVKNPDAVTIGCICSDNKKRNWFNGSIDEVMLWNRSLSAEEIKELYRSQGGSM